MGKSVPQFGKATTIATRLRDAGCATGLVGKWRLGYDGDTRPTRMDFGEFYGFLGGKLDYFLCFPPDAAVSGKWKLVGGKLHDLEADPREKTDVAGKHPEIVAKLAEAVRAWRADVGPKPAVR